MKQILIIIVFAAFASCGNGGNETKTDSTSMAGTSSAAMDTDSVGSVPLAPGQNGTDSALEGTNASGK